MTPNVITGGIGFYEPGNRSLNNQYSVKATNIFGGHQVRYGVQYDDVDYSNINQRTGPTFTAPDGRQTATGAQIDDHRRPDLRQDLPRDPRQLQQSRGRRRRTTSTSSSQDTWKVGNRLTIKPGHPLRAGEAGRARSSTDFQLKNNWAPRIGATYDLTGDGKTKLFGNFGRFYARIPNDLAARALSADDGISRADYFDAEPDAADSRTARVDAGGDRGRSPTTSSWPASAPT